MEYLLFFLIMVAGYVFLEFYFRSQHAVVTWYDRIIGGIGGILLLAALWFILDIREELEPPESYIFIIVTMLPAIGLGVVTWLAISRRK
jgi:hypothetical protein